VGNKEKTGGKMKKNKITKQSKQKGFLIPLDENGEPYGFGLLFGSMAVKAGIPVGTYKQKTIKRR
jgi:hypothetical protein